MLTARRNKRGPKTAANSNLVFVEKAPHEDGFAAHFEQCIKPKLLKIEEARLNALAAFRKRVLLAILGGVTVLVVSVLILLQLGATGGFWFFFAFGVLVGGWTLYEWVSGPMKQYSADRKQTIIPDVLNFVGDFLYEQDGKIADYILKTSGLFKYWDGYESEDLITGRYCDRAFQFVEAELSDKRGEGSSVVFKGFIFALQIRAPESHTTIAVRDRGKVMGWLEDVFKSFKNLKRVPFDHPDFEDKFDVYSTDEAEARQLITPRLIQAVLQLGQLRYAETIEFGVNTGAFLLKIATERDLFELVEVDKSALTSEDSRRFLEELHDVLAIIETVALATDSQTDTPDNGPPATHPRS